MSAPTPARWRDARRHAWLLSGRFPGLAWLNVWQADRSNPPEAQGPALEVDRWYLAVLLLFVPLQFGLTLHGAWLAAQGGLGVAGFIGLVLTVGGINGAAINTAHELGH